MFITLKKRGRIFVQNAKPKGPPQANSTAGYRGPGVSERTAPSVGNTPL